MDTEELLRNIITLPITCGNLADEMLTGNFRSVFKGQGMEFDEARHYEPGDDIRSIDWNASARFGTPYVKMYREERELSIIILLDVSPSMQRRNLIKQQMSPYEQALIATALIAFSAERSGQRAGAVFFDKDVEKVFPVRRGRRNIISLIMAAMKYQQRIDPYRDKNGSNIAAAISSAQRLLKKRSLVVIISDFFSINWENEMENLCRKHDVIAVRICDSGELPYHGLLTIQDPETGIRIEAPAGRESFRESWSVWHNERAAHWVNQCRISGASFLDLSVNEDAHAALLKFFGRQAMNREGK
jgi:uncharacterized protein (DUF58 family)